MVFLVTVSIIAMATVGHSGGNAFAELDQVVATKSIYLFFFLLIVFPLIVLFLFNVFLLIKAFNDQREKL